MTSSTRDVLDDASEVGRLRPVAASLRAGAIAIGLVLVVLDAHGLSPPLLAGGAVTLVAVAVWRSVGPPHVRGTAGPRGLLVEAAVALGVATLTGGWVSPYRLYLVVPVLLLAVRLGLGGAVAATGAVAVAFWLWTFVGPVPADATGVAETSMLLVAAAAAGWVVRRALLQAEAEHDRTLGRVQQLGHVDAMLSTLHDVVRTMPAPLPVDGIVRVIRAQLDELFAADAVALLLADGGGTRWRLAYAHGLRVPPELAHDDLPAPLQRQGPRQRPIIVDALGPGEGLWEGARSGAYLWLWLRGRPAGVLVLEHGEPGGIPAGQHDTLERLGVPLALALDDAVWFRRRTIGAEEERQRIAAALHDRFAQSLVHIAMSLDRTVDRHPGDPDLVRLRGEVRDTLAELRETLRELRLRVTDDRGLAETLGEHLERFGDRFGLVTSIEVEGDGARPGLPIEQQLLRIVQDLLGLAQREAGATAVRLNHATGPGWLRIVVSDDGRGTPVPELGAAATERLAAVRERADAVGATVEVTTVPGEGTDVVVTIRGLS